MGIDASAFYDRLQKALREELPGEAVQLRMAPPGRRKRMNALAGITPRDAAVLIAVYFQDGWPFLLLTERKKYEGVHSGQVSFPGGKYEPDETDPVRVALRECEEETGLDPRMVRIAGQLTELYIPPSNMLVRPVAGVVTGMPDWKTDPREVESLLHVEIAELMQPELIQEAYYQISAESAEQVPFYAIGGMQVWGATAMMLSEFIEILDRAGFRAKDFSG